MNKTIKILLILLPSALLFLFPQRVNAQPEVLTLHYLTGDSTYETEDFYLYGELTAQNKAEIIYSNLFSPYNSKRICIPEGTRLLAVDILDGMLLLDVSADILQYGGGSAYEQGLVSQIMLNASEIEGVETVTLLIEGERVYLPEGTELYCEPLAVGLPPYNPARIAASPCSAAFSRKRESKL